MEFPYFQFPWIGDGLIIAFNAVLHVFISHGVAIGLVFMIFLAEWLGWRRQDPEWEDLARRATKPAVIVITGVGAVTGVGIWFITSGVVPSGIGSMLRVFFWPWFIEWLVFFAEVITILVYYFTWRRWSGPRKHLHVHLALVYVALAIASAVLITGILGFMLTSDAWPWNRSFGSAFFNPSFVPQLAWRLSESLAVGSALMLAYVVLARRDPSFRRRAARLYATILFVSGGAMAASGWWWFYAVPSSFKTHAMFSFRMMMGLGDTAGFWWAHLGGIVLVAAVAVCAWLGWRRATAVAILPSIGVLLLFVAEFEWVREFVRGPYLMPGYMYANEVLLTEHERYTREGMLPHAYWYNRLVPEPSVEDEGAFLFAQNCGTCHTIGGRNDIRDRFRGRPEDAVYVILGRTDRMIPFMPPFSGTDAERRTLARFITKIEGRAFHLASPVRYPPAVGGEGGDP